MKKILFGTFTLAFLPSIVFAQATVATYLTAFGNFLNGYIIPLIVAIAVLFFVWGLTQYLIMGAHNEESREKGRQLALWGILAFVLIVSLWGITNALISGFGIGGGRVICPDYYPNCQ